MPDSVLDALPDAPGLRAVRAKVHAEASAVCPNCGRRHLLDSHCSAAPEVVHDVDAPPIEAPEPAEAHDAHRSVTAPDDLPRDGDCREDAGAHPDGLAVERDHTRARQLLGSVITHLGLDSASFGEFDDDGIRAGAAGSAAPTWLWPVPADAELPPVGTLRPRVQRVAAFLGFDVGTVDRVSATDEREVVAVTVVATSSTVSAGEDEPAPGAPTPGESAIDVGTDEAATVTAADDAPRPYWRRADDDILYRPSRRPRSPRRAWRDRAESRHLGR